MFRLLFSILSAWALLLHSLAAALVTTYNQDRIGPYIDAEDSFDSMIHVAFAPNLTLAKGTLLAKITATGKYAAYNDANADGTQVASPLIAPCAVTTDATGLITNLGLYAALTLGCFTRGYFRCEDIIGLDAAGLVDIKGAIVTGSIATGTFKF